MLAYNLVGAPVKLLILRYFQKNLKLSMLAELQNKNLELESFFQVMKKVVVAKAKANL